VGGEQAEAEVGQPSEHDGPGHRVVVTAGVPFHVRGTTNMLRVEEL